MFPSLRLGYLVLPESLVEVFSKAKWLADRQPPTLCQSVLAEFIAEGYLERHIRKIRLCYGQRRHVLVQALSQHFGQNFGQTVEILGDSAGLHVMAKLPLSVTDNEAEARAARVGVEICSARAQYEVPNHTGEFVFGYTAIDEDQIKTGIHLLAQVFQP